ncbi:glycosyltransferase family 4 protein [Mangrovibacillus cuniculi]|uniref:Glycosyltransferase family 4 protein n=1 Tax=Mangrovibacillus cuniculi TaxID=2593652 RepID=A0A7S8HG89_9BACI|nr:glycosyltransferase family 4 protein [Mangrovibacillus cuniculi]QPC47648.1 glycosyltransferase family 4 protein [Mangrovibacillus cuniculi]
MRLLFIGDLTGNTGPANVNKLLIKYLPKNTMFLVGKNRITRVFELFLKIRVADSVLFSGMSKINIIGLKLANLFGVKSAYLMHGCRRIEGELNHTYDHKSIETEDKVLDLTPKIICVSKHFMSWMKENYPQYERKITYVNNGVDWESLPVVSSEVKREQDTLMAVGGGLPLKNILTICKAIQLINQDEKMNLKLIVLGNRGKDLEEILSYSFVEYFPHVNHSEMPLYYQRAKLFVQNSKFETFGLASIEALINGCDLLLSNETGAKSIISGLETSDIIYNTLDVAEISSKIKSVLIKSNNKKLLNSIDHEETSVESSVKRIKAILYNRYEE